MFPVLVLCISSFHAGTATPPQPPQPSHYGHAERDGWVWQPHHANQAGPYPGQADYRVVDYRQEAFGNQQHHMHPHSNQSGYPWMPTRYDGHPHQAGPPGPSPQTSHPAASPFFQPQPAPPNAIPGPSAPVNIQPAFHHHPQPLGQNFSHQRHPIHPHPLIGHQSFNSYPQHSHPMSNIPASYQPPSNQSYPAQQQPVPTQNPRPAPSFGPVPPPQGLQQAPPQNVGRNQPTRPVPPQARLHISDEGDAHDNNAEAGVRRFDGSRDRVRNRSSPYLVTARRDRPRDVDRTYSSVSAQSSNRRVQAPTSPVVSRRRERTHGSRRRDDNVNDRRRHGELEQAPSQEPTEDRDGERENARCRDPAEHQDGQDGREPRRASAAVAPRNRSGNRVEAVPLPATTYDDILRRLRNSILAHGYLRTFMVWPLSRTFHARSTAERASSLEFMLRCRNLFLAFTRYEKSSELALTN